jgi:triphosphoribosyl-dephospho-CoA synthase
MNPSIKKLYYQSCVDELKVIKPGNFSIHSRRKGMDKNKFELVAKISSEILSERNLTVGESIFKASTICFKLLRSNYNLGIVILCAPIFKIPKKKNLNFKFELNNILKNISEEDGEKILLAIQKIVPAGLKKYSGKGDISSKISMNFKETMKIGSQWDRISRCYTQCYREILEIGLPYFIEKKKKFGYFSAIQHVFINFLATDYDSHILRKFGNEKASKIQKIAKLLRTNKCSSRFEIDLRKIDKYLKFFNLNPGTCADLTVTTLLISKIRDIFKFRI